MFFLIKVFEVMLYHDCIKSSNNYFVKRGGGGGGAPKILGGRGGWGGVGAGTAKFVRVVSSFCQY